MIDKIIEFKKEFGWHGVAFTIVVGSFIVYWYAVEIINIFQKIVDQVLTNVDTQYIMIA